MKITEQITSLIKQALENLGLEIEPEINLEHPADSKFGDYSCNIAMQLFKSQDKFENPRDLAQAVVAELNKIKNIKAASDARIKVRENKRL